MAINLFIPNHISDDPKRQAEYDLCLKKNRKIKKIDAIHNVFPPDGGQGRPCYNDFFREIRLKSKPDDVNIMANQDIYFDKEGVDMIGKLKAGYGLALLRWEMENGKPKIDTSVHGSQDVWIFRGHPRDGMDGSMKLGTLGCDNRILYEMAKVGYIMRNPAEIVKTYHVHESQVRTYKNLAYTEPPYYFLSPTKKEDWWKEEEIYPRKLLINQTASDHILCNGLVRTFAEKYGGVYLLTNTPLVSLAKIMYRDDPRIVVIPFKEGVDAIPRDRDDTIRLCTYTGDMNYGVGGFHLSQAFYNFSCLDPSLRWDKFHMERNMARERKFLEKYGKGAFAFIHQEKGAIIMPRKEIDFRLNPVFFDNDFSPEIIFDFLSVMEYANQVHVSNGPALALIDTAPIKPRGKLFFHRYALHPGKKWEIPELRKDWIILD